MVDLIKIILGGLLGSAITYWFGVRHLKTETEIKVKVEKYNNLVKNLRGFIGQDACSDLKKDFFREWETSWLYCSDEVFCAVRKMVEYVKKIGTKNPDNNEGQRILGEIILAMRKDLLGKKTNLTNQDFIFWEVNK